MAFLPGLLGALGGPMNIIKSVGSFVGDALSGIVSGKPVGETLLNAGKNAIGQLTGSNVSENLPDRKFNGAYDPKNFEPINGRAPIQDSGENPPGSVRTYYPKHLQTENGSPVSNQVTNSRPMMMNNAQVTREVMSNQNNLADTRPVIITNTDQPSARFTSAPIYKPPHQQNYYTVKGTSAGFPDRNYQMRRPGKEDFEDYYDEDRQKLSKNQRRRERKKENKRNFYNYMK